MTVPAPHVRALVHPVSPQHPHRRRTDRVPRRPHPVGELTPRHPRSACSPVRTGQTQLAARFAHRLVEVLTGHRPAGQLQRHTSLPGYQQLTALVRTGPLRPRGRLTAHRLGRVYDSAPTARALEVCVRVEFGPRHHMVAFRLERHRRTEQWQCTAVEAR
ncbi:MULTISPECIES: Rv3235 family protein [unclassified Kitasatospora]|uniref:Rv3235 family protein n=1 Tax=unclassified Kitasatospora TaxID=2633591 RepID=UPI0007103F0D|nr:MULTISPECIES: Rv3235 family protein [unclassified Kitasatospora]KQV12596.1 hypothetical protein ASC99_34170 [Kitasatospora sp. Root107]KRB67732.1 hypothetical protein ASE03_30355 [Kitasatospora sp. Root187]